MIIQCCICHKYKEKRFFRSLWLHYTYPFKQVSHGYCPRCLKKYLKENNL